jgi:aspartate ammonia-lyase
MSNARTERDPLGPLDVPADALYGVQTLRAVQNFPISGLRFHPALVRAITHIKRAAALTHRATKRLDDERANAIVQAADEVLAGRHDEQFVVDVYQAGAGTSMNMNVNEVLANRANEILGKPRGAYAPVHPNDHVNMAQSTNDVIPSAMRIASLVELTPLAESLSALRRSLMDKSGEFDGIVKAGRTHLQDAMPIRLGQEFGGWAASIERDVRRLSDASDYLRDLGIGGSAVGTGVNVEPEYPVRIVTFLRESTGQPLRAGVNRIQLMQSMSDFVGFSGALRSAAVDISQIASDLRLMASGPRTGLDEVVQLTDPEGRPGGCYALPGP